jgi:hypothetical protein
MFKITDKLLANGLFIATVIVHCTSAIITTGVYVLTALIISWCERNL